jgi:hypothetical protein
MIRIRIFTWAAFAILISAAVDAEPLVGQLTRGQTQWEYGHFQLVHNPRTGKDVAVWVVGDSAVVSPVSVGDLMAQVKGERSKSQSDYHTFVNLLGMEGWELVNCSTTYPPSPAEPGSTDLNCWFKRQRLRR